MKDATGELSMTVVVIIAVIAILGILSAFLLPSMSNYISETWNEMSKARNNASNLGPGITPGG